MVKVEVLSKAICKQSIARDAFYNQVSVIKSLVETNGTCIASTRNGDDGMFICLPLLF